MSLNKESNIIKIEARHEFTMFPRSPVVLGTGDDLFGITKWSIDKTINGTPKNANGQDADEWDSIIVKGTFNEPIDVSKTYTLLAKEINDEKYGIQYELMFCGEIVDLNNTKNQRPFLRTFLTEKQIDEMYTVLPNPLKTIAEHDYESLKKVKGIGDYICKCIVERYENNKDYSQVYIELDGMGLTPRFIQKLISTYKNPKTVIRKVKENPYALSYEVDGVAYRTADKIALANGFKAKDPKRIAAYIVYLLDYLAENSGHSFITAGELTGYIFDEFGGKENILEVYVDSEGKANGSNIKEAIDTLKEEKILIVENKEDIKKTKQRVYLKKYYDLEKIIANYLKEINEAENIFEFSEWENKIKKLEEKQGWDFTGEQMNGIRQSLDSKITFITGGSGTGKTSVLSGILLALGCYDGKYSFAQTALSGKASARMQEVTREEGQTIHRLLAYNPRTGFGFNEMIKLPHNIIVLDEISLVGGEIFKCLIRAIETNSKLIILGDMGQLEAIGCMNLAKDLFDSKVINVVELTKTHRQARASGIIEYANMIRNFEQFFDKNYEGIMTVGELQDMVYDISIDKATIKERTLNHFKDYWNRGIAQDIMDIQVLCPVKDRGEASVFNINNDIQEYLNPNKPFKNQLKLKYNGNDKKHFFLREGDKVMNIKNNYKDLFNTKGENIAVFNGWEGIVRKIDQYSNSADIYFPIIGHTIVFPKGLLEKNVVLGYASTVHKYQGSSSKIIIGAIDYSTPPDMLTKELAYTLQTRAEKYCTIVAQNSALRKAISTSGVSEKNTFLREFLDNEI